MPGIAATNEWTALKKSAAALQAVRTGALFDADPARAERFSLEAAGLFLDYSRNKISTDVIDQLLALAKAADLEGRREALFAGEAVNVTEQRAALHMALRDPEGEYRALGQPVSAMVRDELKKMARFCRAAADGGLIGYTGKPINRLVNIGIGGSDLGPLMAVEALRPYWREDWRSAFVSNVDGQHLADTLRGLDPARTLFLIASKSFTTQETLANAASAKAWFLGAGGEEKDVARHFAALSTNGEAVAAFGIDPANMFQFWDWVGGRFSLWSAIGLSAALQIGFENFERLLAGARAMDAHFKTAPLSANMPALLALVGVWNRNFMGAAAHAILPYDQRLHRFPAFLQQAEMESNGKRVSCEGAPLDYRTAPILFGEPGTNGQHAFYQLLHQGTDLISADFIAAACAQPELGGHHEMLLANFLAQPQALMRGQTEEQAREALTAEGKSEADIARLAPHKVFPGDRPSNSILMERLTPEALGALIALYEHKIFAQGALWNINSFDQWGVELGKTLAHKILPAIAGDYGPVGGADASARGLIGRIKKIRSGGGDNG